VIPTSLSLRPLNGRRVYLQIQRPSLSLREFMIGWNFSRLYGITQFLSGQGLKKLIHQKELVSVPD
jgi:hypothetical protein